MFDLHLLVHALEHGLLDSIKLLPFLFLTYLLMEFLEDRMNEKAKNSLMKAEKSGPVWGAVLGMLPQCGFSAAASNLYVGRIITMGTLISIYLSTSDEMLPIMISEAVPVVEIAKILAIKVVIGMVAGMGIDFVMQNLMHKELDEPDIHHFCEHEHCECGHGILKPAIRHTVQIWLFIFIITIVLNVVIELVGLENLSNSFLSVPVIGEMLIGLIGLIPNCASSVLITQLYLSEVISFGTMMTGLLVGAGVGILILLRVSEDKKDALRIIGLLYVIGVVSGVVLNLL